MPRPTGRRGAARPAARGCTRPRRPRAPAPPGCRTRAGGTKRWPRRHASPADPSPGAPPDSVLIMGLLPPATPCRGAFSCTDSMINRSGVRGPSCGEGTGDEGQDPAVPVVLGLGGGVQPDAHTDGARPTVGLGTDGDLLRPALLAQAGQPLHVEVLVPREAEGLDAVPVEETAGAGPPCR